MPHFDLIDPLGSSDVMNEPRAVRVVPLLPGSRTLPLREAVLADGFEHELAGLYKLVKGEPSKLVLDLSEAAFVEIATLASIVAIAAGRRDRGAETRIRLPKNKKVRDFLAVWRFLPGLARVLKVPIAETIVSEDVNHLDEPITSYKGHRTGLAALEFNPDSARRREGGASFFEFLTLDLTEREADLFESRRAAIPRNEAFRWQGELIKAVLATHIATKRGDEDEVSRVVIYEALANAVQHPDAHIIQLTSRFERRDDQPGPDVDARNTSGHLVLVVWDDGQSMVDTLGSALRAHGTVRKHRFPISWHERIAVRIKDVSGKTLDKMTIDEADDPPREASDEVLLMACLFPGVTRTVTAPVLDVVRLAPRESNDVLANAAGMGLYTFVRTVLDRLGGSVGVRCGRHFMSLKVSHDTYRVLENAHYKAAIRVYPDHYPPFKGNMLIARLPIRAPG